MAGYLHSDMDATTPDQRTELAEAVALNLPFDGWGAEAIAKASRQIGIDPERGAVLFPRGAVDIAAHLHRNGDAALSAMIGDLEGLRYSEKVAELIWQRLLIAGDKDLVRKATSLFSLPQHAVEGAGLIWGTADAIWTALGDTSRDGNWYTKRATLSAVYGPCVLYWLGDSGDGTATRAFIDRRIANIMAFEKFKASTRNSKLLAPLAERLDATLNRMKAPVQPRDFPGKLFDQEPT